MSAISRRQLLQLAGTSAIAASIADAATSAASATKPWRAGLGLNGFMSSAQHYKKSYPIWEVLDFAATQKFDGIELVDGWPEGPYPSPDEPQRVAALKRLYDQYGLRVYTFQTGSSESYAAAAEVRKKWLAQWTNYVRLAKLLGCDFIGNWPGGGLMGNANVDEAIKNLASSYREAATICADAGIYFSFEIEPPFIFNSEDHLKRILAEVNHPACKTNYDPSHFDLFTGGKGKPHEMLQRIGVEHIGHIHLTDCDGTLFAGTSKHIACGDGHIDLASSFKTLRDGGYSGWIMLDNWMIEDVYDAARKGKAAIDKAKGE